MTVFRIGESALLLCVAALVLLLSVSQTTVVAQDNVETVEAQLATNAQQIRDLPLADVRPLQADIRFLAVKLTQHRHSWPRMESRNQQWADLESAIERLKRIAHRLTDIVSQLESIDTRLRNGQVEAEVRMRELKRVIQYGEQRIEALVQDRDALQSLIDAHNAAAPILGNPQDPGAVAQYNAAIIPWNAEADDLNERVRQWELNDAQLVEEVDRETDRAIESFNQVWKAFGEKWAERRRNTEELAGVAQEYDRTRASFVEKLILLEEEGSASALALTPFGQGLEPADAELEARVLPPIGPSANVNAIDQLRVVTSSSRSAAGRDDDNHQMTDQPSETRARVESGYQFDLGGGLFPARLPEVDGLTGRPVESEGEPLVMATAPMEREGAPRALVESPVLREIQYQQDRNVERLKKLYEDRRECIRQGPDARSEELTKLVDGISKTIYQIALTESAKSFVGGSKVAADPNFQNKTPRKSLAPPLPSPVMKENP